MKNSDLEYDNVRDNFYYKKDRLNQLRGFCATVQSNSNTTKAAEKLGLEIATVGKQIRSLERDLNVKLFDRKVPNKLMVTDNGIEFYNKAILALQHIDTLFENSRKDLEQSKNNILRIASFDIILNKLIPYIIEFKKIYPNINISLLNIQKNEALKRLIDREIDLALFPNDMNETCPIELKQESVSYYKSYWIMYKGHKLEEKNDKDITREEIASYPFGILSDSVYVKSMKCFIEEYSPLSPIILENGTIDILKTMIRKKMCLSIINEIYLTNKDKKEFILKNTLNSMPKMNYYCFSTKTENDKEITKNFLEVIKNNHEQVFH